MYSKTTIIDKLGDPASWPSVPEDFCPPNDSYLEATLGSASYSGSDVYIVAIIDGGQYTSVFPMVSNAEAERVVARIQRKAGELLVQVVNLPLDE